ncbi:MAG: hypothetical protein IKA05_04025 [Clostridia bacterium]|nr:hypothetical protein [Clostridia bacterium]
MGKGNRNRQRHLQDKLENSVKQKPKKQLPKWLYHAIAWVLVAAVLVGVVASVITETGIVKRNRVLLKSETGNYDVNQQMATFIVWQEVYYTAYSEYYSYYTGSSSDTSNITSVFSNASDYALTAAQYSVDSQLRDCVDDVMEMLKIYVAVCDEADRNDIELEEKELKDIDATVTQLKSMQTSYGFVSFDTFLKTFMGKGMKEKDIRAALELVALYNKYASMKQDELKSGVTAEDIQKYLEENPDEFYKIDYLTYAADTEEFANILKECATAEDFKTKVLEHHLAENYKKIYNKYVTTVLAKDELASLSTKTDSESGTALSDALDALGADAEKEFSKNDSFTGKEDLKTWLFDTKNREQYDSNVVPVDDGVYLVVFYSEKADSEKVSARVKFYEFVEGEKHGDDDDFKKNILEHITQSKAETPSYPVVDYKKASDKANALKTELTKENADIAGILEDNDAVSKTGVTSSSSSSVLPKVVRDAATKSTVKAGDVLVTNNGSTYYVIHVSAIGEDMKVSLSYVTVEHDTYYKIIDDLTDSLNDIYPTTIVGSYKSEAKEDTFEAWISELASKDEFKTARKEFDTAVFETEKNDVTTYHAYMVINTPLYLQEEEVVEGGYLVFDDDEFATDAQEALNAIKDNTDLDLIDALYAFNNSATISSAIKESTAKAADEKLAEWLFSDDRAKDDIAVITAKDEESAYVAVFTQKLKLWESNSKAGYVAQELEAWAEELAKDYTPNEKALKKLGTPTPTTESSSESSSETTEETTTAA